MLRTPVTSSHLDSVGYDPHSKTLEIEFNDGSVYQYFNVPERVYQGLMRAYSKGEFFHDYIRDTYSYTRV